MDIQISCQYKKNSSFLKAVSKQLKRFGNNLDSNNNNKISVVFVDDLAIKELNIRFRHLDKPTNVLSFELGQIDPEDYKTVIGEIIISVDTAKKEASRAGMTLRKRLIELFIHGYVHLLGYDHTKNKREAIRMKRKEKALIKEFQMIKSVSSHKRS